MKHFYLQGTSCFRYGRVVLGLLGWVSALAIFYIALLRMNTITESEQLKFAQKAVVRSAVQCYAMEGAYPKNISYLREHYGLLVDEEKYLVDYVWIGSNLMPDITVLKKEPVFGEAPR